MVLMSWWWWWWQRLLGLLWPMVLVSMAVSAQNQTNISSRVHHRELSNLYTSAVEVSLGQSGHRVPVVVVVMSGKPQEEEGNNHHLSSQTIAAAAAVEVHHHLPHDTGNKHDMAHLDHTNTPTLFPSNEKCSDTDPVYSNSK